MDSSTKYQQWQKLRSKEQAIIGALRLHNGCKVVHVKSYLKGLWASCQATGDGKKEWIQDSSYGLTGYKWKERLVEFDCVVFAAGAGLFQASVVEHTFPIQLVCGQSIIMRILDSKDAFDNAVLCGKYVSPLPERDCVLIGATHEFKKDPLTEKEVEVELRERSYEFASSIWDKGSIDNITIGYRVQSNRGKNGRLPIIGSYKCVHHDRAWIFTGLSSRGLLYHGLFGKMLSEMILGNGSTNNDLDDVIKWWQK
jgi:glycine/D-amino acid oxidase-like deaminating enzyme